MEEENVKLLSPKIDVVFQALFGEVGNETITKKFRRQNGSFRCHCKNR